MVSIHRCRRFTPIAMLGLLLLAFSGALAQAPGGGAPPDRSFAGEITTTLVEVPVRVLVDDEPARGLSAEDFELYEDGERREIRFFDAIDLGEESTGRDPGARVPDAGRRNFLLFFDLEFTPTQFLAKAQQAALHLVRDQLDPADRVGVAFYHGRSGSSWVVGLTSDRSEVVRALEELGRLVGTEEEGGAAAAGDEGPARSGPEPDGDPLNLTYGGWGVHTGEIGRLVGTKWNVSTFSEREFHLQQAARASALVGALESVARQTRFVDGVKYLTLFSQGFQSFLYTGQGLSWLYSDLQRAIEELRRAGWTVQGIDVGEVWADWRRRQKRESLALLADSTGGQVYAFAADPTGAVERVARRTSVTYVLGFETEERPADESFHELRVELVDAPKGARINHRSGYFSPGGATARGDDTWRADAAELLQNGEELDEIGIEALASPVRLTEAGARVPVVVEIERAGVEAGSSAAPQGVEVYTYAFSPAGEVEAAKARRLMLEPSDTTTPGGGYKLIEDLRLPPGKHEVRVLVRDTASGRVALRTVPMSIPLPGDRATHLLPPLFMQRPDESWVLVSDRPADEEAEDGAGSGGRFPFKFQDHRFLPSVVPVMTGDESQPILIVGFGLPEDGKDLRVRVVDAGGLPVPGAAFAMAGREQGSPGAPDRIALDLRPGDLLPGTYSVEASVVGVSGWSPGARFRIVDGDGSFLSDPAFAGEGARTASGFERDELGMKAVAFPVTLDEERARVPVMMEFATGSLTGGGARGSRDTEIQVYALDDRGTVEMARTRRVVLDPSRLPRPGGGFKVVEELDLPPGEHEVRIRARSLGTGRVTSKSVPVRVPPSGNLFGVLLPPVFVQESDEPWMLLRDPAVGDELPFPYLFQGTRYLPAVEPTVPRDGSRPLMVIGYGLPSGQFGLELRVVAADGQEVEGAVISFLGRQQGDAGSPDILALEVRPTELDPGVYTIQVALGAVAGWTPGTRFRVVESAGS